MIVARKRLHAPTLKIAQGKFDYLNKTGMLYHLRPATRKAFKKREPETIPFDQWIMPPQEQGYIKCRKFDFL